MHVVFVLLAHLAQPHTGCVCGWEGYAPDVAEAARCVAWPDHTVLVEVEKLNMLLVLVLSKTW